jgi:S1-C subfamily serine protease
MRKLAYIFCIALFLFGCGANYHIVDVSYNPINPIDPPRQFFTPKDKQPILYIDPVIDNRELAVKMAAPPVFTYYKSGRFEEDPTLIQHFDHGILDNFWKTRSPPSEIIREALEKEVHRLGIKITKDRDLADGVLNASIEDFTLSSFKINLKLYQTSFYDPVWSGTLKGAGQLNPAFNKAIKQWYSYPGFREAMVSIAGNVSSPPSSQQPPQAVESVYSGTGFLFSAKDYVITNWHVVRGTNNIKVKFLNGEKIEAEVALKDPQNDIAFLKLERQPQLPPSNLKIGDSSNMKMGDKVFTIGYPAHFLMGDNPKYTEGVVNATSGLQDDPTVFQVSVEIQPGNSGGPLFNETGEVIGITSSSLDPKAAVEAFGTLPQNVNYAIKSSYISALLPMLPQTLIASRGIMVVPTEPENTLANFIEKAKKNIVLIEAKE